MEKKYAVRMIEYCIGGYIVYRLVCCTVIGVAKGIDKAIFNHKIKKGMKDGSIVKIDGVYYEVGTVREA